eukprot:6169789-Pyramimonas_sp.AAC.1
MEAGPFSKGVPSPWRHAQSSPVFAGGSLERWRGRVRFLEVWHSPWRRALRRAQKLATHSRTEGGSFS